MPELRQHLENLMDGDIAYDNFSSDIYNFGCYLHCRMVCVFICVMPCVRRNAREKTRKAISQIDNNHYYVNNFGPYIAHHNIFNTILIKKGSLFSAGSQSIKRIHHDHRKALIWIISRIRHEEWQAISDHL